MKKLCRPAGAGSGLEGGMLKVKECRTAEDIVNIINEY
jgi:hypothetical protein